MLDLSGKTLYFISDLHLGSPNHRESLQRERLAIKWIDEVANSASVIFLLGDVFDFWFEWKHVVPRGFTRFLGKIGELTDRGVQVHFFTGNHDIWIWDYLPAETGMIVHKAPLTVMCENQALYIAHGDGLGKYDRKYNFLKRIFTNPLLQWMFARLHPNFAIGLAKSWSGHSRKNNATPEFLGGDNEWLILHSQDVEQKFHHDYYIYGHRHLPGQYPVGNKSTYINTGDWLQHFTYAAFNGKKFTLYTYYPRHAPLQNQYIKDNRQ